ncbi:hypothetical protein FCV25MIE_15141 [Fagus crenata]
MHQANDLSPPHLNAVVVCLNMQAKMATNHLLLLLVLGPILNFTEWIWRRCSLWGSQPLKGNGVWLWVWRRGRRPSGGDGDKGKGSNTASLEEEERERGKTDLRGET